MHAKDAIVGRIGLFVMTFYSSAWPGFSRIAWVDGLAVGDLGKKLPFLISA